MVQNPAGQSVVMLNTKGASTNYVNKLGEGSPKSQQKTQIELVNEKIKLKNKHRKVYQIKNISKQKNHAASTNMSIMTI